MARYDSPGFQDRTPAGPVNESTGAPGSPSAYPATDSIPGSLTGGTDTAAVVTPVGASLVNADRVPVGSNDTLTGSQVTTYGGHDGFVDAGDGFSHTGAGEGSAGHFRHPNSMNGRPQ